ncbi:hypothetical protein H2199_005498 [Coniosporium tulheliwenetii]|uniref:Uncharacterized protein n=1 Tax=Coniosporium tulheliwenetii TaxID=3383036 RepID=A0ACC2Z1G9_9PEZI|nr:hypothetical protein H2199_005498 [Cladosporium sp. JES 115]
MGKDGKFGGRSKTKSPSRRSRKKNIRQARQRSAEDSDSSYPEPESPATEPRTPPQSFRRPSDNVTMAGDGERSVTPSPSYSSVPAGFMQSSRLLQGAINAPMQPSFGPRHAPRGLQGQFAQTFRNNVNQDYPDLFMSGLPSAPAQLHQQGPTCRRFSGPKWNPHTGPSLHFMYASGTIVVIPQVGGMLSYYLLHGENVQAFPAGFRCATSLGQWRNDNQQGGGGGYGGGGYGSQKQGGYGDQNQQKTSCGAKVWRRNGRKK